MISHSVTACVSTFSHSDIEVKRANLRIMKFTTLMGKPKPHVKISDEPTRVRLDSNQIELNFLRLELENRIKSTWSEVCRSFETSKSN